MPVLNRLWFGIEDILEDIQGDPYLGVVKTKPHQARSAVQAHQAANKIHRWTLLQERIMLQRPF